MIIAVDFDGTIVEHEYPLIGKEIPFATATLRQLIKDGHKLILWTVREGDLLKEALQWCEQHGVHFYAVNSDIDENAKIEKDENAYSRKIKAHVFIDDRNVGGLPDWGAIYEIISSKQTYADYLQRHSSITQSPKKKKKWLW